MKKILILVVIAMLTGPLFANEGVLIDFSLLAADINVRVSETDTNDRPNQHRQTIMDFAHVGGASFTPQQRAFMRTSLAIENWDVTLASSARTWHNMAHSFTREAASRRYGTVMGVRVSFPVEAFNSWAMIRPPFDIPAFETTSVNADGTVTPMEGPITTIRTRFEAQEEGAPAFGVIKNVGIIREVAVRVHGLNLPHGLSVILIDSLGRETNHLK